MGGGSCCSPQAVRRTTKAGPDSASSSMTGTSNGFALLLDMYGEGHEVLTKCIEPVWMPMHVHVVVGHGLLVDRGGG